MAEIALVGVFAGLPDGRRKQGKRHSLPLCLALFTLAVAAGNQGFRHGSNQGYKRKGIGGLKSENVIQDTERKKLFLKP